MARVGSQGEFECLNAMPHEPHEHKFFPTDKYHYECPGIPEKTERIEYGYLFPATGEVAPRFDHRSPNPPPPSLKINGVVCTRVERTVTVTGWKI